MSILDYSSSMISPECMNAVLSNLVEGYRAANSYRWVTIIVYPFSNDFHNAKLNIKIRMKGTNEK